MVRKRLAAAILVSGALHSGFASALGLGELTLRSALNQPFRAEILVRDVGELDVEEIKIALADDTAFENAGVERSQFLSSLEFQVELLGGGNGKIIVTTTKTVQEPYLDFIVEVRWPSGKINREYTVLLDLPVFSPASSAPTVNVARSVPQSTPVVKSPVPKAVPAREPGGSIGVANRTAPQVRDAADQQSLPKAADPTEYRVQHHDTMWKIAEKLRPSSYVTTQQTMIALLKMNPKAFVAGNVNRIKSGYVLRIPNESEVNQFNHDEAVDEIREQDREWRGGNARPVSSAKKSPVAKPSEAKSAASAVASAPQLDATDKSAKESIAPEEQAVKFSVGSAGSDTTASNDVDALRQKVREERENLEKFALENGEMQARVVEMEKQIRTLQNLITLKNSQLAALQTGLASGANDSGESLDAEPSASEDVSAKDEQVAMAPVDEGSIAPDPAVIAEKADAAAAKDTKVEPAVKPTSSASNTSLAATAQAWLSNGFVKFIGLGVAVLALLILVLRRRRNEVDNDADLAAFEASLAGGAVAAEADVFSAERDSLDFDIGNTEATELSDPADEDSEPSFNADDFDFDKLDSSAESAEETAMDEGEITVSAVEAESVQPQTGDIVAEADIYVAYGRYDQAASLLKTAIAQDPENADLHVKLADIYLDTRDRDNFSAAFAELKSLGDADAVARVKESMSAIEGVSDWLDDGVDAELGEKLLPADDPTAETVESDLDFELDEDLDFELGETDLNETPANTGAVEAAPDSVSDFEDLDIDFDLAEPAAASTVSALGSDDVQDTEDASAAPNDESIRDADADADTLASLDVDLADLDFDFEPESEAKPEQESVPNAIPEDDSAALDFNFDEPVLGEEMPTEVAADKNEITTDDDEEFDFSAFDESEEIDASSANGSEPDSLAPGAADVSLDLASADEDLDLDLSAFEELSAGDDELLNSASDLSFDEEDLDLGKAEDEVTVNLGAVAGSESADEDLDLNLEDFDTPLRPAALDSASNVDELGADLASDDEFFVDAGDGDNAADSAEASGTESVLNSTEAGGIDVEDLSFDEFDVGDDDEEFDTLLDTESVATKLDLARAYVDMGDSEGAREMLEEVLVEGDTQQQSDAQALLDSIGK